MATVVSKPAVELAQGVLYVMTLQKVAIAGVLLVGLGAAVTAGGLAAGAPAREERRVLLPQAQAAPIRSPALPGAVAKPPDWLGNDAPFDVAAFFVGPPLEENAATRYLDALFEFSPELEVCFPAGNDRQSRKQSVEARLARFFPVYQSWSRDPGSVDAATIDAVVEEFDTGFRKIDWCRNDRGVCLNRASRWRPVCRTCRLPATSFGPPGSRSFENWSAASWTPHFGILLGCSGFLATWSRGAR